MTLEPPATGLERVFRVDARVGTVEDYGMTRAGHRRVVPILGGVVTGGVEAEILPGGATGSSWPPTGASRSTPAIRPVPPTASCCTCARTASAPGLPTCSRPSSAARRSRPTGIASRRGGRDLGAATRPPAGLAPRRGAHLQGSLLVAAAARSADRVLYGAYREL